MNLLTPPPTKDQWGFYKVGEFKFYSKLEAIEASARYNLPLTWDYNSSTFSKFNWSQEPPGDISFWYKQRAQQLRNQYQYLVLFYSGGADSHNMLMSFVKNNIFVDEIVQFHTLDGNLGDKDSAGNEEVFATSAPFTQRLIDSNPIYKHTKHRLIDKSRWQMNMFLTKEYKWDLWYELNQILTPGIAVWSRVRDIEPAYRKIADSGKTVAFVWGYDKPMIDYTTKDCKLVFRDSYAAAFVNPLANNSDNEFDESFYFTPNMPELVCKQSHIVKRFISQIDDSMVDEYHVSAADSFRDEYGRPTHPTELYPTATVIKHNKKYSLMPAGLHKLVYPWWNPVEHPILCGKTSSSALSDKDQWMLKGSLSESNFSSYFKGLVWLKQHIAKISPAMWGQYKPVNGSLSCSLTGMSNSYKIG